MKTTRLDLPVMSSWMELDGRRLNGIPYLSGAFEAKVILEKLPVAKEPLQTLTRNGKKGIFNGPRFARNYVDVPQYGIPLLSGSEMLQADISLAPLISRKLADSMPYMILEKGTTLISSYGTIGRTVYCRSDMEGMVGSDNVMKVIPDNNKILPGYLFAFLSSRFGIPLVVAGTSGSVITFLDPSRVAGVPVPRLGNAIEAKANELVEQAAKKRCNASEQLKNANKELLKRWGLTADFNIAKPGKSPDTFIVHSKELNGRFDAFYHSSPAQESDTVLDNINLTIPVLRLGDVAQEVFETTRFGRIAVEQGHGIPFLSISDLGRIDPKPETFVSKKQVKAVRADVKAGWIILPRVGQLQGVFGRPTYIPPHLDGIAVSDNNLRIVPKDQVDSGYLFAALSTSVGYWQIVRQACGTSIPYLDTNRLRNVRIPWCSHADRQEISDMVTSAMMKRSEAVSLELKAISSVEAAIEENAASEP